VENGDWYIKCVLLYIRF